MKPSAEDVAENSTVMAEIIAQWHPGWVVLLAISAILALNSPKIIKALGDYFNTRLKIKGKIERDNQKLLDQIDAATRTNKGRKSN